jgi:AcrR family transcriptional regulator
MASPLRRPLPERRDQLVRHFVETIEPLLEHGATYAGLSVEQIIRAGGISRASFYGYFRDKGDLLQALAQDVNQEIAVGGDAWWGITDETVTLEQLREGLRPAVDAYLRHTVLVRAVAEASAYDANVRGVYVELMSGTIARLAAHIEGRQQRGLIAADLDASRTATWLVWMLERGLYQAVSVSDAADVETWLDSVTRIVWSSLYRS